MDYDNITMCFDHGFIWFKVYDKYYCQFMNYRDDKGKSVRCLLRDMEGTTFHSCIASGLYRQRFLKDNAHKFNHDYLEYLLLN